ncbi:MAG: hypothetical protein P8179_05255 [Candidatus Thiodiazotropha sp.]|jgi:hypothetical protein
MQKDPKKPKALSDRALELVMQDVLSGLIDVSLQLGNKYLNAATLTTQSGQDVTLADDDNLKKG